VLLILFLFFFLGGPYIQAALRCDVLMPFLVHLRSKQPKTITTCLLDV